VTTSSTRISRGNTSLVLLFRMCDGRCHDGGMMMIDDAFLIIAKETHKGRTGASPPGMATF